MLREGFEPVKKRAEQLALVLSSAGLIACADIDTMRPPTPEATPSPAATPNLKQEKYRNAVGKLLSQPEKNTIENGLLYGFRTATADLTVDPAKPDIELVGVLAFGVSDDWKGFGPDQATGSMSAILYNKTAKMLSAVSFAIDRPAAGDWQHKYIPLGAVLTPGSSNEMTITLSGDSATMSDLDALEEKKILSQRNRESKNEAQSASENVLDPEALEEWLSRIVERPEAKVFSRDDEKPEWEDMTPLRDEEILTEQSEYGYDQKAR
ncbi:hypothetical protein HY627_00790 [Candidatus Uhrbacteria bacterium]|nr:hypothetical protein [Candidatus Uhrbacteria bacterium]